MNLLLAIVAGLWYWYAMCRVGYTLQHIFCQPLVMAVPFGLIMGDLPTALIIGAGIEMMYVGLVSNGGNIPADECPVCYCTGASLWTSGSSYGSD